MNTHNITPQSIQVRDVAEDERLNVLPRRFGRYMLTVEHAIYRFMRELSAQYQGGYWRYVELSNGGFYMAPAQEEKMDVRVATNGFGGEMSADAAGITACLFAFSHLSFQIEDESIARHFHELRELALEHPEASAILDAID